MAKVSVLVPARNEIHLGRTVQDLLDHATGDIEVLAILDGYDHPLPNDPRVIPLRNLRPEGMRPSVNMAAQVATGEFLMKCDAHCSFAEGYDEVLQAECDVDWVVVPRRYSLDPVRWVMVDAPRDAHYLGYPFYHPDKPPGLHGLTWKARAAERQHVLLDDEMSSQGSCWFMSRQHWDKRIGPLDVEHYGPFVNEFQEVGCKTWLGGGRVVINKKTAYAHLFKRNGQGYVLSPRQSREGRVYCVRHWMLDQWPDRVHDLRWLIEKFSPVPEWPADLDEVFRHAREVL